VINLSAANLKLASLTASLAISGTLFAATVSSDAPETRYLEASATAMQSMMRSMQAKPTGEVDRDFVAQMIPHHQGAIDMAVAMLRYGRNEQLRRLAQEIIVTQHQEIEAMRQAIDARGSQ
jgi:uncharacterized protein (DUF305 family)